MVADDVNRPRAWRTPGRCGFDFDRVASDVEMKPVMPMPSVDRDFGAVD
jgi:hypothetical protein